MIVADLKILLAKQLGDPNMVYWTSGNLDLIINESLLTFGSISQYWKDQVLIEPSTTQQFYDLLASADITTGADKIAISLVYQDIINWLDADLINYLQITTQDEVIKLISNAINDFQSNTKLVLKRARFNIIIDENISITPDVLDIAKAYYIDSLGRYWGLKNAAESRVSLYNRDLTITPDRPQFYSIDNLSLQIVDLFPKPNENGFLELIYVQGTSESETNASSCIIPNNFVPYLKYRILADIWAKDGISNDPYRAAYAEKRWQEGLAVGTGYSSIINTKLNGLNKVLGSLDDFDAYRYNWYNDIETGTKKVNAVALTGYNILAINRKPIFDVSLLLQVISNAPINQAEIDLRSDFIPYLLDYAIHLASIKDGVAAIQKTTTYLTNFVQNSVEFNQYLQSRNIGYADLLQKSKYILKQAKLAKQEEKTAA